MTWREGSTEYEEGEEGAHESPDSGENGEERTVESDGQPDQETRHQAVDGEHLAHAQDGTLQHLQEVDRLGGVVPVVIVDVGNSAGVCLPVEEGDDGHEVE